MPRDPERMKLVGTYVTKQFKRRIEKEAKKRGISVSDLIREELKKRMGEDEDIGTQKRPRRGE